MRGRVVAGLSPVLVYYSPRPWAPFPSLLPASCCSSPFLTHSSASDLILAPQDMARETDPSEEDAPHVNIPTVNEPNTGRGP